MRPKFKVVNTSEFFIRIPSKHQDYYKLRKTVERTLALPAATAIKTPARTTALFRSDKYESQIYAYGVISWYFRVLHMNTYIVRLMPNNLFFFFLQFLIFWTKKCKSCYQLRQRFHREGSCGWHQGTYYQPPE